MEIKQFEDKNLSHYSYAVLSKGEIAVIDPARNPQQYYDFAKKHDARITNVIETHPHADFVSSHLEIHQTTGANIYVSKLLNADYPHRTFDDGDSIELGDIQLKALNTPGHSPDSISVLAVDKDGKEKAVFTGDTLFIGDCGRPDLREKAGAIMAKREELAGQMYDSLREKMLPLRNETMVYPAHGAGSLCGKGLSSESSSTIGNERVSNWSLQKMSKEDFVKELLSDQPFIPKYFAFDVAINKQGAPEYKSSVSDVKIGDAIKREEDAEALDSEVTIIDTRPQEEFKTRHLKGAINLPVGKSFETWLGSIVRPQERFYLLAADEQELKSLITRAAKIGYEKQIERASVIDFGNEEMELLDSEEFRSHQENYTIIDVRNPPEVKTEKIFAQSINIPLYELRERTAEIPTEKPIVVHCAAGYRSAAGSSIVKANFNGGAKVLDLSEDIKSYKK